MHDPFWAEINKWNKLYIRLTTFEKNISQKLLPLDIELLYTVF